MESAYFHQHQQEDHQILVDSSCYGLSCHQNPILKGTRNIKNSRDVNQNIYQNIELVPMSQNLGLTTISMDNNFKDHELLHLARIKQELISVTGSCLELPEIISSSPTSSMEDLMPNNNNNTNQEILLRTFSNGCQIETDQLMNQIPPSDQSISYSNDTNSYCRGTFSQIFPTINVPNLNQHSTFDINLPALDPFGCPSFNGSLNYQPSSLNVHTLGGFLKDNCLSYGVDQRISNTAPAFILETTEAKRSACNYVDAKAPKATLTKKSKLDLRCSPLKIRKEKLGDRISALQQMVAPFCKTDTASVLMEAIGYIKFLQNQVETLSVPYMNSTHKASRIPTQGGSMKDGNEETKTDLRSRGLCLVPVSCLTYVTYGGGTIWGNP